MATAKTETIRVRIVPAAKDGLKVVAAQELRSLASIMEVVIQDYCERAGVAIFDLSTADTKA